MKKAMMATVTAMVLILSFCLSSCLEQSPQAGSEWPVAGYSFGGNFDNWAGDQFDLMSFGNLAFTDKGILEKGIELSNGYMELQKSNVIKLKDGFTFSIWVKVTDPLAGRPMLFSRESSGGDIDNGPVSIRFSDDYRYLRTDLSFVMEDNSIESYSFASDFVFTPDSIYKNWHHIGVVFQKDTLTYYIDGILSSTEQLPEYLRDYKTIANTDKDFTIGRGAVHNLKAVVDEVRFYDAAILEEDMMNIYQEAQQQYQNQIVMKKGSKEIWVNGTMVESPIEVTEDPATGRLVVPIRLIVESMGGTVAWDGNDEMGRADITLNDTNISIWLYDTNAIVNNRYYKLDAYPTRINDVTCVPVRFIGEELGALVEWKEQTQEVILSY